MAFNIYDMLGALDDSGGFTKASKFLVEIYPPQSLNSLGSNPNVFFLCDSANLPGISLSTDDVQVTGYGISEKRPRSAEFGPVNLSFFCDSNTKVFSFFHRWLQSIYNFNLDTAPSGTAGGLPMNTFAYPKEYYGVVNISHFDDTGEQIIQYTLNDAFPTAVGDIPLDWGLTDQLIKIPVSFVYKYWTAQTLDPGEIDARSQANYFTTQSTAANVDFELKAIRELLFITSPAETRSAVNIFSNVITLF